MLRTDHTFAVEPVSGAAAAVDQLGVPSVIDVSRLAGAYEVSRLIGEGSFARVYLARDCTLGRSVALKVSRPEFGAEGNKLLLRGARAQARVFHPAVIPVYACGELDHLAFAAMPYCERGTLGQELRAHAGAPLPIARVAEMALALAQGVSAVHAAGIVHRDLKPANILLGDWGAPLIADFGIALGPDDLRDQTPGAFVGTPSYMSPEQARGEILDTRSDLFSFGLILRELLGVPPSRYRGPISELVAERAAAMEMPTRELAPHSPPELADLVDGLLARDSNLRPPLDHAIDVLKRLPWDEEIRVTRAPANGATVVRPDETDALIDELIELEHQFPEPDFEHIRADARWIDAHWGRPELTRYRGEFVAVYEGAVVAHGRHELRVKRAAVESCRVHPQRVLLQYIPEPIL